MPQTGGWDTRSPQPLAEVSHSVREGRHWHQQEGRANDCFGKHRRLGPEDVQDATGSKFGLQEPKLHVPTTSAGQADDMGTSF